MNPSFIAKSGTQLGLKWDSTGTHPIASTYLSPSFLEGRPNKKVKNFRKLLGLNAPEEIQLNITQFMRQKSKPH